MVIIKKLFILSLIILLTSCSYVLDEIEIENRFKIAGSLHGTAVACENKVQVINSTEALMKFISKQELISNYSKEKLNYFYAVHQNVSENTIRDLTLIKTKTGKKHQVCSSDDFINNTSSSLYSCIYLGDALLCL